MGQPGMLKTCHQLCWSERGELKHLSTRRKRKKFIDSLSSGDRTGKSLNRLCYGRVGVVGPFKSYHYTNWNVLESSTVEGDSPVQASVMIQEWHLSRAGHVQSCLNPRGPSRKAKYSQKTDSEPVL